MLFNSAIFLFVFLPVVLGVFLVLVRHRAEFAIWWLIAASLVFYSMWDWRFAPILIGSIAVNFLIGREISRRPSPSSRRALLALGVAANLTLLGYFKYLNFFVDTFNVMTGVSLDWPKVILPIGISFFTFQQLAFLIDSYRQPDEGASFSRYTLFVIFFPHLIAGPITHHREVMPQLGAPRADRWFDLASGLTLLAIGLFKKVVIADALSLPVAAIFDGAAGRDPSFIEAWTGAVCYGLQIYFDFSAYSDMAVGLARMFGVEFPINFASPYKAVSFIDFWRRWHITLSRFLRDYLYIPLGGNRRGVARQRANIFITMLLGGIWHGAGWTFVVWGALHGAFLSINHLWAQSSAGRAMRDVPGWSFAARFLTLICVFFAWVPFRAKDTSVMLSLWRGMSGMNGISSLDRPVPANLLGLLALLMAIVLLMPNSYEIMRSARMGTPTQGYPATFIGDQTPMWRLSPAWAALAGIVLFIVVMKIHDVSEFIYFQF